MINLHQRYKSTFCVYVLCHGCDVFYISIQYTEMLSRIIPPLLFLYPPFSLTPLPSTYFILIQCQGHWSKAICSLTSSKFSFCQALFQCLLLICHDLRTTLFLSPWTMQLCRLSSAKPCVTLCDSSSFYRSLLPPPPHLSLVILSLRAVNFTTARTVNLVF